MLVAHRFDELDLPGVGQAARPDAFQHDAAVADRFAVSGPRYQKVTGDPTFQSDSTRRPYQYCRVSAPSVSARHTLSGVAAIWVT